ncbi:hypothetical protein [Leptospira neocaledonica]|uniref:hypothetical protein n=1 Tax=Leptospira neocaledonica TaxID=2023192 RepID=UPI001FCADE4A|nr:hypothetical protein [Leptospira neocaledonica]
MYYKLLRWVKQQWLHGGEEWCFYPDEHTGINWESIIEVIENTDLHKKKDFAPELFDIFPKRRFIRVQDHAQVISEKEPLVQAIDLFSGLHRFSRENGDLIFTEIFGEQDQHTFFEPIADPEKISRGNRSKITVFHKVYKACSDKSMYISFKERRYLWSRKKEKNMNFWFYEPMGELDKAPKKGGPSA